MIALFVTILLTAVSLLLALAAGLNETGRRVGGITFYRIGRWRFSLCRVRRSEGRAA